ncbi:MAG: glycine zipper family protein [Acidimicrobiales bacterium]
MQAVGVTAVGAVLGWLVGGTVAALVLGGVSLVFAVAFGLAVARGEPYRGSSLGAWRAVIDATWSALNTWAGAIYYATHRVFGNPHDPQRSRGTGSIWLERGFIPHGRDPVTGQRTWYATTIGTVKAGSYPAVDPHEQFHVFQARLLGPFYLPLVAINYVVATIIPYWLVVPSDKRRPVTGVFTYFTHGVYPHVWNEAWAYHSKGPK